MINPFKDIPFTTFHEEVNRKARTIKIFESMEIKITQIGVLFGSRQIVVLLGFI